MGTLYIDTVTFGDREKIGQKPAIRQPHNTYAVSDGLIALFNSWRFSLEPAEFISGLIADAMDEEEGAARDDLWTALAAWMRDYCVQQKTLSHRKAMSTSWYNEATALLSPASSDSASLAPAPSPRRRRRG